MKKRPENDRVRLLHMLEAAQEAVEFSSGHTRNDLKNNRLLQRALVNVIATIGEAATNITDEFQARHPQIAWQDIKGIRIRLHHIYYDIDLEVVGDVAINHAPSLIVELQNIIGIDDK